MVLTNDRIFSPLQQNTKMEVPTIWRVGVEGVSSPALSSESSLKRPNGLWKETQ